MTHTAVRRVLDEVRIAARETPRLYFEGVRDFAQAFRRFVNVPPASPVVEAKAGHTKRITVGGKNYTIVVHGTAPSSLRLGKKNRLKKQHKLPPAKS